MAAPDDGGTMTLGAPQFMVKGGDIGESLPTGELDYFTLNKELGGELIAPIPATPFDPSVEHKLAYPWTISEMSAAERPQYGKFDYGNKQAYGNAVDPIHNLATIKTLQDFWKYWNGIPQPSEIFEGRKLISARDQQPVSAIMIFREDIRPEWEDPRNAMGGDFQIKLAKKQFSKKDMYAFVDECWNNLICGVIGGTILPASMVTGIRLLDRMSSLKAPMIRVEVWFTDSAHLSSADKQVLDEKFNGDYKRLMSELWQNIERAMLTRLDGTYDNSLKCWEESQPNMHNKK